MAVTLDRHWWHCKFLVFLDQTGIRQGAQVISSILPLRRKGWKRSGQVWQVKNQFPRCYWQHRLGFCNCGILEDWGMLGRGKVHLTKWGKIFFPRSLANWWGGSLEIMEVGDDADLQSSEEVVVRVYKQRVQGEVDRRDLESNQTRQRGPTPGAVMTIV